MMTSYKVLALLFGLLSITTPIFASADEYRCDHDDHVHEIKKMNIAEDMSALGEGRRLQSGDYPKLRVRGNYEMLGNAPSNFERYIRDELGPPILSFIAGAFRVKYPVSGLLRIEDDLTCGVNTPNELFSGVEADYYLIFDSRYEESNVVASSRACVSAIQTGRPLTAYSNINRYTLKVAGGDVLVHEKNMYLLIHEIFHTLGISQNSYDDYIDDNGNRLTGHIKSAFYGGVEQMVIDIPPLTEKLRNYYGCPTLKGLIMENDGGSGTAKSHLERKFFTYEVIASGGIFGRRVSEFSLGLLEGSGWYVPDYSYAEPFFIGQGEGCKFIEQQCSSYRTFFDDFCTGQGRGCAPQGRSGGRCQSDALSNGCKYFDPAEDWDCDNANAVDFARFPDLETYGRGENAKCFTGNLNTRSSSSATNSFCFKFNCVGTGADTQLEVKLGTGQTVTCNDKGPMSIDGYYGVIDCPDPLKFCDTVGRPYCPRNCLNRGKCIDNVCKCNEGFTGIDCGLNA